MGKSYRIEKFEPVSVFRKRMKYFDENTIECTSHTLFRLSEKQREVFRCEKLKHFLLEENPLKVGIQYNGNYAVYYKFKGQKIIKIIISFKTNRIRIITFYILHEKQLPRGG